jgi:hypothetical protein
MITRKSLVTAVVVFLICAIVLVDNVGESYQPAISASVTLPNLQAAAANASVTETTAQKATLAPSQTSTPSLANTLPILTPSLSRVPPTKTATPTITATRTATPIRDLGILPGDSLVVAAVPTPAPPIALMGIAMDSIIVMPDSVKQNTRAIFAHGQALGRNAHAFSKLGDSTIENPYFLARFDTGPYNLGPYAYLQHVIGHFKGSFGRKSVAVIRGFHTWAVFDPIWSDPKFCRGRETVLECEFRINNPSVLFIRMGSNDVGIPQNTDKSLRRIVEYCITNGVIPIMGTKADRHDGPGNVNNIIIRQIAKDYNVPLWDFDLVAGMIPGRGLERDGVHMTSFFAHDWTQPIALQRGHGVHSLTALMALDMVWREAMSGQK